MKHLFVMLFTKSFVFLTACLAFSVSTLQADVFELRSGGTISGTLLNDPSSNVFKIQTYDGVVLEISSGRIKQKITIPAEVQKIYQSMAGKEDTVALHRAVSLELNRDYTDLARAHRERVVELDPSEENWNALGGHFQDPKSGEWLPRELINKRKGLVKAGKGWDTPQSQAISKSEERRKIAIAEMNKQIDREWKNLKEKAPKGPIAMEFFRNLNDPLAIPRLEKLLFEDLRNGDFLLPILAKMPGNTANGVFLRLSMQSSNAELSNVAMELLNRTAESRENAFQFYLGILDRALHGDKKVSVNMSEFDRAASNLQGFADKRAIPTLIDSLVSTTTVTQKDPGTQSINSNGNVSMGTGTTRTSVIPVKHPTALATLVELANGANFQFDQVQWRIWYAKTFAKSNLNLRRDE